MSQETEYFEICCICLDENNKNNNVSFFNLKCCNGSIHKRCLLTLILNSFDVCPLCRTIIDIKSYYNIQNLNDYLTISDIKDYKRRIYYLLHQMNHNRIVYYLNIIHIEIRLLMDNPLLSLTKFFKFLCVLFLMAVFIYIFMYLMM